MEKHFKREIEALDSIFEFTDSFISEQSLGETIGFSTRLVVEEIFTNLVRHNTGGLDHIAISLDLESSHLVIKLQDFNVDPVNIPESRKVDLLKPLSEREVGGLGIHLVKSIVDKLTYEYKDRILSVTAVKNLEG
jgi:anti-sigma regulatory factor (Ser/Thr protein kinase)